MDEHRFDTWTRTRANDLSRRVLGGMTGALTAAGLTLLGRRSADAFICRQGGVLCGTDAHCCSGVCDQHHRCVPHVEICAADSTCNGDYYLCGEPDNPRDCAKHGDRRRWLYVWHDGDIVHL